MEKPFHLWELEARIRSLTRRKICAERCVCLESGGIKFDTVRREAYAKGENDFPDKKKWHFGIFTSESLEDR